MREILFRGKDCLTKEWVYGYFWKTPTVGKYYISGWNELAEKWCDVEVIPETVSQFTGLTDKNGVKIFEHDTVKMYSEIMPEWSVTIKKVKWFKEEGQWSLGRRDARMIWEVIGNIHDGGVK